MDTRSIKMVLSSNGRTLPLGKGCDFDIEEVTGLESSEFKLDWGVLTGIHGDDLIGKKITKRPIHIVASLRDDRLNEIYRKDVIRFFNPIYTGNLYVKNMEVERQIDYEIEGWTFDKQVNLWDPLRIIADLVCPDPFMRGMEVEAVRMSKSRSMFAFPYKSLSKETALNQPHTGQGYAGTVMGYRVPESLVSIYNDGDVPTGYVITLKATRGVVENPRLVNSRTGDRLRMKLTMNEGDVLVITISDKVRTIKLNGENVYMKIDRASKPFMLEVGDNEFEFFAEEGFNNLDISMTYSLRFLGV